MHRWSYMSVEKKGLHRHGHGHTGLVAPTLLI